VKEASTSPTYVDGDLVDLGATIGALTDHSITWTLEGVDYMIASNNMTQDELVEIARSVQGEVEK
jgi:L-asparaginase/Glu-tRNA(Gln) amidotransferase subunit D